MSSYSIEMNDTNLDLVPNNRRTSDTELGISSTGRGPETGAEHHLGSRTRHPMAMELRPVQRWPHRSSEHIQSEFWTVAPISKTQFGYGSCLHISDPMLWVSSTSHPNWIIWMDPNFTRIGLFGWIQISPNFTPDDVFNLSHDMDQVDQAECLQSGAIPGSYSQVP